MVTKPTMSLTVPPVVGIVLPMLKMSLPLPPFRFNAPVFARTLNVSAPTSPLTVVPAEDVLLISSVSSPLPSERFNAVKPL